MYRDSVNHRVHPTADITIQYDPARDTIKVSCTTIISDDVYIKGTKVVYVDPAHELPQPETYKLSHFPRRDSKN